MFCIHCGSALSSNALFCGSCGKPAIQSPVASPEPPPVSAPLAFGRPVNRWGLAFAVNGPFPEGYEWLGDLNTLLVCRNHLVLVRGNEKRSSVLDVAQSMGLVGVAVGAIRAANDSFLSGKMELSADQAQLLFESKHLVWCSKSDAKVWRYHEKPWLFIKSSSEQLYCKFSAQLGDIHACAVLWCTAEYGGNAKGDINALGCQIESVGFDIPEKLVRSAFENSINQMPSTRAYRAQA